MWFRPDLQLSVFLLTGMPVKVTGGDCQEMLKLPPLGVNLADPGMVTGGVACETEESGRCLKGRFPRSLKLSLPR